MAILLVWWACLLLESLVLLRAFMARMVGKYPFFYLYVASVFVTDIARYAVYYHVGPPSYIYWYWATEFICLITGYGIILDILERGFGPYEGAKKFGRTLGLVLFGLVLLFAVSHSFTGSFWPTIETAADLEKLLRMVQGLFLLGLLGVIFYYGIALGRNVKGMLLGYGLYIATVIMGLAIALYFGPSAYDAFSLVQPFSYLTSLLIWTVALWSYHPNPVPDRMIELESDYETAVLKTRIALGAMRSYLARAARP
jgi:hypothetical protein